MRTKRNRNEEATQHKKYRKDKEKKGHKGETEMYRMISSRLALTLDERASRNKHQAADKWGAIINTHPVYHQKLRAHGPTRTNTRAFQTRTLPLTVHSCFVCIL